MGVAAMLVMWCKAFEQLFIPKDPEGVYEILFQSSQLFQSFQRRSRLKLWADYTIRSPEHSAQVS